MADPKKRKGIRMRNIVVDEVSLVDKAANGKCFLFFKRASRELDRRAVELDRLASQLELIRQGLWQVRNRLRSDGRFGPEMKEGL